MDTATRRLLFWLKAPYLVDIGLGVVGVAMLLAGRQAGWWVMLFGAGRALVATVALVWLTPRLTKPHEESSTSRRGRRPWPPSRRRT